MPLPFSSMTSGARAFSLGGRPSLTPLATIGLTIPAVAVTATALGLPLSLGLPAKEVALLALTLLLTSMTLTGGRATVLQGAVHLVVFAVFLFLAMVP